MALAHRVTKSKATAYFVDENCLPQTVAVARTRAEPLGWKIIVGDPFADVAAARGAPVGRPPLASPIPTRQENSN